MIPAYILWIRLTCVAHNMFYICIVVLCQNSNSNTCPCLGLYLNGHMFGTGCCERRIVSRATEVSGIFLKTVGTISVSKHTVKRNVHWNENGNVNWKINWNVNWNVNWNASWNVIEMKMYMQIEMQIEMLIET